MKAKAHRRSNTFQQAWQRTFGTHLAAPRAGRRAVVSVAVLAVLTAGAAMADWKVSDKTVQNRLGEGNVNSELKDINSRLTITKRSTATEAMVKEPTGDEALNHTQPSAKGAPLDALCPSVSNTGLARQQRVLCEERVKTELAQYRFSLRMFERAKENYDRLKTLEDHRRSLGNKDYAKLEYNTNEVLALTARMDNDRDRYNTYMAAYAARIQHIENTEAALTRNVFQGTKSFSVPSIP